MYSGKHFNDLGVARNTSYIGTHRENHSSKWGVGYIPLGDRNRATEEDVENDRSSVDISTSRRR